MSQYKKEITRLHFEGPRFEDHGLDFDVLPDLIAYKKLLIDTAVGLWWGRHPERKRIDRGFESSIRLKFFSIESGSATVPVLRVWDDDDEQIDLPLGEDEVNEAADLIEQTIEAVGEDRQLPENLPANVVHLFGSFGKCLEPGESISVQGPKREHAARHTPETRDRLERWQERTYEDFVELVGEVRAASLDGRKFVLRMENDTKVNGEFLPEQESLITSALHGHESRRLRVVGRAEYSFPDGAIKRVTEVTDITMLPIEYDSFDDKARPIWEIVAEMGAEIPEEEWKKVPTDLARNHDHYLYGAAKEKP
jgi:hypothetical protein